MARLDGRVATAVLLVAALTAHICFENLAQAERDEGKEKKAGTAIGAADANTTVKTEEQIEEKREKKSGEEDGDADALESHDEVVCCGQNDRNVKPESYATNRALCKDECKELGSEGGQKYGTQGDGDPGTCFSGMKCREAKKSKTLGAIGNQPVEAEVVGSKSKKGRNFVSDLTDIQDACEIAEAVTTVANWKNKGGTVKYDYMKKGPLTNHTCADVSDKLCTLDKRISEKALCKNQECKRVANLYWQRNCLGKRTRTAMVDGMLADFANGGSNTKQGMTQGHGSNRAPISGSQSRSSQEVDVTKDETKPGKQNAIVLIKAVLNICNRCSRSGVNWATLKVEDGSRLLDGESLEGKSCKELAQRLCSLKQTKGKRGCKSEKTDSCKQAAAFTIKTYGLHSMLGKGTETRKNLSDRTQTCCKKQRLP